MYIKDYHKITTRLHNGITFFFFHRSHAGQVDVYNSNCDSYGAYMDQNSFFHMYKKHGETLNLTRPPQECVGCAKNSV